MNQYENRECPYCGSNQIETITYHDPINFNYDTTTKHICTRCDREIDFNNLPEEVQLSKDEIEMSKKIFEGKLYIPCDNVWGVGVGKIEPMPYTLQIDTDLIRLRHKEMELEFKLEPDKLANIDTIILNGYKYVKEK